MGIVISAGYNHHVTLAHTASGGCRMKFTPQPYRCRRKAFDLLIAQLPHLEQPIGLFNGAMAIAMHEMSDASVSTVDLIIRGLTDRIRSRVRSDNVQALLAHAHEVLFEEEGFAGNVDDYHNPFNSYLPAVLETRRGIPITLSLVYKCVVERLGLTVHGINAPGHFLVAVHHPGQRSPLIIDPFFGGRAMSIEEAADRAQQVMGQPVAQPQLLIQTATHRQWLLRMLNNLHGIFAQQRRPHDMAAMAELRAALEIP